MPELFPSVVLIPLDVHAGMEQRVQMKAPDEDIWDISWDRFNSRVTLFVTGQAFTIDCTDTPIVPRLITLGQVIRAIGYNIGDYDINNIWCESDEHIYNLIDSPVETLSLLQFDLTPLE